MRGFPDLKQRRLCGPITEEVDRTIVIPALDRACWSAPARLPTGKRRRFLKDRHIRIEWGGAHDLGREREFALKPLADQVGIARVLGPSEKGRLALFLILARIAHGGSRRSAMRWAEQHAVSDLLGLEAFDENDLYEALDWLEAQQTRIEKRLYEAYVKRSGQPPAIVLYDVTSSYFEGEHNELAHYGYNRDGKKGRSSAC
jgi:hypothetical protein